MHAHRRHWRASVGAAAALTLAAATAQAADFHFSGTTDSGPLPGASFAGTLSYEVPGAGFSGDVALTAFGLQFAGQAWGLVPSASMVFDNGVLLGISLHAPSGDLALRPTVDFVPGFTSLAEAAMAYSGADAGGPFTGFGSYTISAVPEPAAWALLLPALAGAAALRRRRAAHATV